MKETSELKCSVCEDRSPDVLINVRAKTYSGEMVILMDRIPVCARKGTYGNDPCSQKITEIAQKMSSQRMVKTIEVTMTDFKETPPTMGQLMLEGDEKKYRDERADLEVELEDGLEQVNDEEKEDVSVDLEGEEESGPHFTV